MPHHQYNPDWQTVWYESSAKGVGEKSDDLTQALIHFISNSDDDVM